MANPKQYRPDIDGLRAVAVLAVILFHFGTPGFSGGYIGVDVFFVISGYLIIRIIVNEVKEGTFSLVNFWERRIRRIIPAMVVVLSATTVLSYYFLSLSGDFSEFGTSLMLQSLFVSNWWFMGAHEYFAAPSDTIPLLHTWSLAVEEQFYVFFPLLTLFLYPFLKKSFRLALVFLALVSFGYSCWLVNFTPDDSYGIYLVPHIWDSATNSSAAFYFILSRLWEFLVGGIIAVYAFKLSGRYLAEAVSVSGLCLIVYGIYFFSPETPFPGVAALAPVLGTAMLIVANTDNETIVNKMLSSFWVVGVGLISYSLYLWHWPLLSLTHYQGTKEDPVTTMGLIGLLLLVFFLSWATYQFVEKPFRQRRYLAKQSHIYIAAAGSLAALFTVGYLINHNAGFPDRLSPEARLIAVGIQDSNPRKEECFTKSTLAQGGSNAEPCLLGIQNEDQVDFVLWGDSHANAMMVAFEEYGIQTDQTGIFFGFSACAPLVPTSTKLFFRHYERCTAENEAALSFIKNNESVDVFIVSEWLLGYKSIETEKTQRLSNLLSETLSRVPSNTEVAVFGRVPIFPDTDFRDLILNIEKGISELKLKISSKWYRKQYTIPLNNEIKKGLSTYPNVTFIDPTTTLCDETNCYFGVPEGLYYRDSSHLSTFGAKETILPLLMENFVQGSSISDDN